MGPTKTISVRVERDWGAKLIHEDQTFVKAFVIGVDEGELVGEAW